MPQLHGLHVKTVLGRLGYAATMDQRTPGWHDDRINDRLKALEHDYHLSETHSALREIPVAEDTDEAPSYVRWVGGRCQACGKKEAEIRSDCERGGRCNRSEPARFYIVMVETGGSQTSETERRKQRLFLQRGIDPLGTAAIPSPQAAGEIHIDRARRSATLPTPQNAIKQPGGNPVLRLKYGKENVQRVLDQMREALCLTVRLEKDAFQKQPLAIKKTILDIKVDVYCNGKFMTSSFISLRGKKGDSVELCLRFHGKRVSKNGEVPLVATPSQQPSDHEDDESTQRANSRWDDISRQIRLEAEAQSFACEGSRSELGKHLQDIAELKLPRQISRRQSKSGRVFGVLDVVVSVGTGRKYGPQAGYSEEPIQMTLSKLKDNQKPWTDLLESGIQGLQLDPTQPEFVMPGQTSTEQPSGRLTTAGKGPHKRTTADAFLSATVPKRARRSHDPRSPAGQKAKTDALGGSTPLPTGRTNLDHAASNAITSSRRAGRYSYVAVAKRPTQEEEFKRLQVEARDTAKRISRGRATINGPQPAQTSSRPIRGIQPKSHDLAGSSNSTPAVNKSGSPSRRTDRTMSSLSSIASGSSPHGGTPETPVQQEHERSDVVDIMHPELSLRGGGSELQISATSAFDDNPVLSYAPENTVRQVRTERNGEFAESSILFGVRYVVF